MKLLDTSVAVDHLRGYGPATLLLEDLVSSRESVVASELTRFELLAGARSGERDDLEGFFSVVDWIPVTEDVVRRAGEYARTYRRSHSGIGVVDYLLAGTVSEVGADLVTVNVRHFPMFDDLRPPYEYGPPDHRTTGAASQRRGTRSGKSERSFRQGETAPAHSAQLSR